MAPVKERRERERQHLRQEILDSARKLFIREGYENVSMRRIAEQIDYSPTTIYLYFKDKSELLHCLCEETFILLQRALAAAGQDPEDPVGNVKRGLRAYIDFGLKHRNHYKVTFILHPEHQERSEGFLRAEDLGQTTFDVLRQGVAACVASGNFRPLDVEATSQALWAAAHGVTSLLISHPDFPWVNREILIEHLLETMTASLKA